MESRILGRACNQPACGEIRGEKDTFCCLEDAVGVDVAQVPSGACLDLGSLNLYSPKNPVCDLNGAAPLRVSMGTLTYYSYIRNMVPQYGNS